MKSFQDEEEEKVRSLYKVMGAGGVVLLLGMLLLIFGRPYGFDGSNYDLFLVFGLFFLLIGVLVTGLPFVMQMRIMFRAVNRKPNYPQIYNPQPSALGQAMRHTQVLSSVAPSSYDGQRGGQLPPQQQQPHQFSSAAAFAKGSSDQLAAVQQSQQSLHRSPQPPMYQQVIPSQALPSDSESSAAAPVPMGRQRQEVQQKLLGHSSDI